MAIAKKQILRILDDTSPSDIKLKNLPRLPESLHNCSFDEYGRIVKRKGHSKYNTDSLGAAHGITGIHRMYQQDFTKEFLVAWNTKWYKLASATPWAGTALLSKAATDFTTTADLQTHFINFKNKAYIVNGIGMWKYDTTYVETVGITVPIAPTSNSQINGLLSTGNYKFKVTYVDTDGFESNGGAASANIAAGANPNDGLKINIPVSADTKIAKRYIYRTVVDDYSTYYYDGAVDNNTTETYDSTQADSTLIAGTELHVNHTAPPTTPHLICPRRSRICIADDENLYISEIENEYFSAETFFPTGNKHKITGLKEQLTTLPVFTPSSLERLTGYNSSTYNFKNAYSNEGCTAERSLCNCRNILVYLGNNGIYYFNGESGQELDIKLSKYVMTNINRTYKHLSVGVYFDNMYFLTYPKGASTVPNETVYFDFNTKTTGVYNLGFSCYSIWDKGTDEYSLYGGSNTIGRVYHVFDGLNDDGADITWYDDVQGVDLGMPDRYKAWYNIYIKVKTTSEATSTLKMYYTLDANTEHYVSKTLLANTTAWYDIGFGATGLRARSLAFKPWMSDKFAAEIQGYAIVFRLEPPKWGM